MIERLHFLWPEIVLFVTTCVVMVLGLSRNLARRKATAVIAGIGILIAIEAAVGMTPDPATELGWTGQRLFPNLVTYSKIVIGVVGFMLLLVMAGTVDRTEESAIASGKRVFDPLRSNRAEFYAFFLFSLMGLMLCASADDLIWLFLALELTSLPTYIMVAISTSRNRGREAGVKYFFLGAMGAATFLYGFALLYGATGSTNFNHIAESFRSGGISTLAMAGLLLSLLGVSFKIAAVPMHFYTPDVYEGAAPQVSGFLAFVPKTAGFISILLLCGLAGWNYAPSHGESLTIAKAVAGGTQLPELVRLMLWVMAALTMTVGNVLAILQVSVKRILAYSSIAHSGYMLVGVIAGPGDGSFTGSGVAAVLFYLLCYGVMNLGCFAVLAALERSPDREGEAREIETIADLRGLCASQPLLGWCMVLCSLSLLGLPPLLGFFGKLPLFTSAIAAGEIPLVIILGLNSAVAAYYYLRLAFTPLLEAVDESAEPIARAPFATRRLGALASAAGVVVLAVFGNVIMQRSREAAEPGPAMRPAAAKAETASGPHAAADH